MLFSLLLALLVIATLALFSIGVILARQQRAELGQRRSIEYYESFHEDSPIRIGELGHDAALVDRDDHALAKLRLEAKARQQMADIIG